MQFKVSNRTHSCICLVKNNCSIYLRSPFRDHLLGRRRRLSGEFEKRFEKGIRYESFEGERLHCEVFVLTNAIRSQLALRFLRRNWR